MDLKSENFLVTGASGFVGASLTRRLVKMGLKVHAMVGPEGDLWRIKDILPSLTLHRGDIQDEAFVRQVVEKSAPDIVYHLAVYGAYPAQKDAGRILVTNVLGTCRLLAALENVPYKLFINTGSSSEYGFKQKPMKEDDLPEPNSYYAVAKAAQTMFCQYAARTQKKSIVTFRLFSVYGPYEEPSRLVPTIIRRCLRGESLQMASPLTARDFIFVEDVVDAYLDVKRLMACGGQVFNIGTGRQTSLKHMTDTVLRMTEARVQVVWNAMQDRIWDTSFWVGDVEKAQRLMGYKAGTSLEEGLRQTIEWMKNNEGSL
jgi:nucleoside-diphosphate-sugar epimerase